MKGCGGCEGKKEGEEGCERGTRTSSAWLCVLNSSAHGPSNCASYAITAVAGAQQKQPQQPQQQQLQQLQPAYIQFS